MYTFKGVGPTQAARIIAYMRDAGYPARKIGRGSAIRQEGWAGVHLRSEAPRCCPQWRRSRLESSPAEKDYRTGWFPGRIIAS